MLQATHDIRKVALCLGHADIRTTRSTCAWIRPKKLEAVEAVIPPELRRGRFKAPDALIASVLEGASLSTGEIGRAAYRHDEIPWIFPDAAA
jgi:integrase/recombinase XerD